MNLSWSGYDYLNVLYCPTKERVHGILAQRGNVLCYLPQSSIMQSLTVGYAGGLLIWVGTPSDFVPGEARVGVAGSWSDVEISTIDSTQVNLVAGAPVTYQLSESPALTQERGAGLLFGGEITVTSLGGSYSVAVNSGVVDIHGRRTFTGDSYVVGSGKFYFFAKETTEGRAALEITRGEARVQQVQGINVPVDVVPEGAVLIGMVTNGVADNLYGGSVLMYNAKTQVSGGVVDKTGRVSVITRNASDGDKEVIINSADGGFTWEWSRVET